MSVALRTEASEARSVLVFGAPTDASKAREALARARQAEPSTPLPGLPHPGAVEWQLAEGWPPAQGIARADLEPLREVEELLAEARRRAAELDEPGAFRSLAAAQLLAWGSLGVPGAAAFCAEIELQLAVTAAQAERWDLASDSLARAARLDRPRRLLAAEARPEVVALADRVFRDAADGAEGEWPIRVAAEGARVFVDDIDRGLAPLRVRVRAGTHALRIEAPGYLPYHTRIEVLQGVRPEQRFVLSPDPRAVAKARFSDALGSDPAAVTRAAAALLAAAPELAGVMWFERRGGSPRELLHVCGEAGCLEPLRLEHGQLQNVPQGRGLTPETARRARAWLRNEPAADVSHVRAAAIPWWNRWYVWSALAVIAIGGGAAATLALEPEPERTLRVVVDSGDLR